MDTKARVGLGLGAVVLAGMVAYVLLPGKKAVAPPDTGVEIVDLGKPPVDIAVGGPTAPVEVGGPTTDPIVAVRDPFAQPTTAPSISVRGPVLTGSPESRDSWATALDNGVIPSPSVARAETSPASIAGTPGSAKTWKIATGESLYTISIKALGSAKYVSKIVAANPGLNPNRLRVGTVIKLPDILGVSATGATRSGTDATVVPSIASANGKTYKVVSGDSLRKISQKLYGKQDMWQKIYDLNKGAIGSNPANLKVGMVLNLPETPVH